LLARAKHLLLEADRVSGWRLLDEQERANIPRPLRRRRKKARAFMDAASVFPGSISIAPRLLHKGLTARRAFPCNADQDRIEGDAEVRRPLNYLPRG
jgi:hypothetical protein